jgi:hypothetical protein
MQNKSYLTLTIACALLLASCSTNTPAAPTQSPEELNTQIAQTISVAIAQTEAALPTSAPTEIVVTATAAPTEVPTATPVGMATNTPYVVPTQAALLPTSNSPSANQYSGDHCQYLYNHPADGSVHSASDNFLVTFGIANNGSTLWTTKDYSLRYVGGTEIYGNANLALTSDVQPGGKIEMFIRAFAPDTAGKYLSYWALYDGKYDFCDFYIYFIVK